MTHWVGALAAQAWNPGVRSPALGQKGGHGYDTWNSSPGTGDREDGHSLPQLQVQ